MNVATGQTWPEKRMRFLTQRGRSNEQQKVLSGASQVTFLPMDGIGEQGEVDCSVIRDADDVRNGYTRFFDGDVLVAKITPCFENGKGALVDGTLNGVGFGTTELHVLNPSSEIDARFLYYITVSDRFRRLGEAAMFGAAGQKRVPEDFVRDYRVPVPPFLQQRAIADYLDRETARLNALIAAKQRLLELLAEKRRALITRAVTCGLDSNIPMRATDIHWLGEIPSHWEIWKLGHVASIGNGSTPNRNNAAYWSDGRIPWVNSGVVNQPEVTEAHQFVTARAVRECHLPLVKAGSVLVAITGQGKTRGGAVVLSIDSTINQHLAFVQPERSCLRPWFLRWMLFAAYDFLRGISDDGGGTKGALTCEQVSDIRVPIPPPEEQAAILDHISVSTQRLDLLQSTAERTIAIIKERRAALIAAAVTGQIAVDA